MTDPRGPVPALLYAVSVERAAVRKAEALHAREHAPAFNMVDLFAPGETGLSRVFRWLLDERETHGQGAAFRELFFQAFSEARIAGADWCSGLVTAEAPTRDGRRIDLLMESADRQAELIIENKPWAGWQERQLESYWLDRRSDPRPSQIRLLALVGGVEHAQAYVEEHWRAHPAAPAFPDGEVFGVGFDRVADWLERCEAAARPAKVRAFLADLAVYCRRTILGETAMTETPQIADVILSGGEEAVRAASAISAALPLALTRDVARRVGGSAGKVGSADVVQVTIDDVPLAFALFDVAAPWAGVTDMRHEHRLLGDVAWGTPERAWPRWAYLRRLGDEGRVVVQAVANGELAEVASLIPALARVLLGTGANPG